MMPWIITLISVAGVVAALVMPGWQDLLLVAGPSAFAGLVLVGRGLLGRSSKSPALRHVIVDGSNVMYWKGDVPRIETVKEVLGQLKSEGYTPGVIFDANAGYLLSGRYQHNGELEKALKLPKYRVMVVPKGEPADPTILAAARKLNAVIVTNDRFRDWADQHPEVNAPGHLIRGEYQSGKLRLNL